MVYTLKTIIWSVMKGILNHNLHNVQSRGHNCVHFAHRIIVGRANDDTYVGFPFIKFPGEPNILNYVNDSLGNPKV